jgi:hypothetical protein
MEPLPELTLSTLVSANRTSWLAVIFGVIGEVGEIGGHQPAPHAGKGRKSVYGQKVRPLSRSY